MIKFLSFSVVALFENNLQLAKAKVKPFDPRVELIDLLMVHLTLDRERKFNVVGLRLWPPLYQPRAGPSTRAWTSSKLCWFVRPVLIAQLVGAGRGGAGRG